MLLRALLVVLFFVFLARAVWRLLEGVARGAMGGASDARRAGPPPASVRMTQCPVCGTYVVPGRSPSAVSRGQVVYYCSDACRAKHAA